MIEIDEFLVELDEDFEGMQSTIVNLQQQLKESKEAEKQLQIKLDKLTSVSPVDQAVNQVTSQPDSDGTNTIDEKGENQTLNLSSKSDDSIKVESNCNETSQVRDTISKEDESIDQVTTNEPMDTQ